LISSVSQLGLILLFRRTKNREYFSLLRVQILYIEWTIGIIVRRQTKNTVEVRTTLIVFVVLRQERHYLGELIDLAALVNCQIIVTYVTIDFSDTIFDIFCFRWTFKRLALSHIEIILRTYMCFPIWVICLVTWIYPSPRASSVNQQIKCLSDACVFLSTKCYRS
jgi:hypothetical protein